MVKDIVKDTKKLSLKAEPATEEDLSILEDLIDTLKFNLKTCVGLAANMIGYNKQILVYVDEDERINHMINPKIISKSLEYEAEEGCLSLTGVRKATRYKKIRVEFYNKKFQKRIKNFEGFTAEIILHEMDHFEGIII